MSDVTRQPLSIKVAGAENRRGVTRHVGRPYVCSASTQTDSCIESDGVWMPDLETRDDFHLQQNCKLIQSELFADDVLRCRRRLRDGEWRYDSETGHYRCQLTMDDVTESDEEDASTDASQVGIIFYIFILNEIHCLQTLLPGKLGYSYNIAGLQSTRL